MLATVWQILNIMRNDRKRKFSELAETCLETIRETITSKHIFGGFELFENHCASARTYFSQLPRATARVK